MYKGYIIVDRYLLLKYYKVKLFKDNRGFIGYCRLILFKVSVIYIKLNVLVNEYKINVIYLKFY